jgi:hypothetical protein
LIYAAGAEVAGGTIPARLTAPQAEQEIMKVLKLAHQSARAAGVQPDPSGSIGGIPYSQISDFARKIAAAGKSVVLKVVAKKEVHASGPLEVDLRIGDK